MSDKTYKIAMVISIQADNYEEALDRAEKFSLQLSNVKEEFDDIECVVEHSYEHDNQGQRCLYLHNEEEPIEDDGFDLVGLDRNDDEE
jgi:hypothetical protein